MAGAGSRVRLDLNSLSSRTPFFRLQSGELKQVVASLRRLSQLDWDTLYRHTGFQWEAVAHVKAPNASRVLLATPESTYSSAGVTATATSFG